LAVIGGGIITALVLVAIFAPLLAPYDPRAYSGRSLEPPSASHLLGTDGLGRDIFSQVVWGARASLVVTIAAAALSVAVGALVGVAAALAGGPVDFVTMRLVDVCLALPGLPFVIVVAALAGPSRTVVVAVIAMALWPAQARVLRGQALSLRERGFIRAAAGFGEGRLQVMRRHVLPAMGPLLVTGFVGGASVAVGLEAGLSFLGLADPDTPSWGGVLNRALAYRGLYFSTIWAWWLLPAGLAVTLAILGFSFLGVGIEPRLNPRWRAAHAAAAAPRPRHLGDR